MAAGISWPKAITLVAAFAFLAGAAGHWIGHAGPPGENSVDAGFARDGQCGAEGMARLGSNAESILQYYYPGCMIVNIY